MGKLFSFNGRVRRIGIWVSGIAAGITYAVLGWVINMLTSSEPDTMYGMTSGSEPSALGTLLTVALVVVFAIFSLSVNVRRWHDLNKSGWWVLINLVPLVGGLYAFILLGFMSGDQGPNSYGPPPEEGAIL